MTSKEWCARLGAYDVRESAHEDFWTFCPCHADQSPRMHVYRTMSGSIAMRCFVCGADGSHVCRALGLSVRELEGEPMRERRRRRRIQEETHGAQEPLVCMACGREMDVDVRADIFAGGYIAQGKCRRERGGCGLWLTQPVHAQSREAARSLLNRAARESWQMMADKMQCARSSCAERADEYDRDADR